jgi:hypothetical protein
MLIKKYKPKKEFFIISYRLTKMKLIRLKSIAYNALRTETGTSTGYMEDPFYHITPKREILVDLISGTLTPNMQNDDVEKYYKAISKWFHEVLPKEGIPIEVIEKAIIIISPKGKKCIIKAQGREFTSEYIY